MAIELVERRRVQARGEVATIYEVVEYQLVIKTVIDSRIRTTKSGYVYRLADGRDVDWVNSVMFQIVDTRQIITRCDALPEGREHTVAASAGADLQPI